MTKLEGELEYRMGRIRDTVASLPGSTPIADAIVSSLSGLAGALPSGSAAPVGVTAVTAGLATGFASWWATRRTPMFMARLEEALFLMAEEIHRIQLQGIPVRTEDPEFLVALEVLIPTVMRTQSEAKRQSFAMLLAHTGVELSSLQRDQGQTMALLLEQLGEQEILLLDRSVRAIVEDEQHERLGRRAKVFFERLKFVPETDGPSLLRLHSLNLLQGGDNPNSAIAFREEGEKEHHFGFVITSLGLLLHRWIQHSSEERG